MLRVVGQVLALRMTQPVSSDTVEGSNIHGGGRRGGARDIPSFVFGTASRESFATLFQLLLARIIGGNSSRANSHECPPQPSLTHRKAPYIIIIVYWYYVYTTKCGISVETNAFCACCFLLPKM